MDLQQQAMDAYLTIFFGLNNPQRDNGPLGLRARLYDQGFQSVDAARSFRDDEAVASLCRNIRKPGGQVTIGGNLVSDPGQPVPAMVELMLKHFVFWSHFQYITQRNFQLLNGTPDVLRDVYNYRQNLIDDSHIEPPMRFTGTSTIRDFFDSISRYLTYKKGPMGIPVLYVIREDPNLPATDPGFGQPDFGTELATRGRLEGTYFTADNALVWSVLEEACRQTHAWQWIVPFQRTQNGRGAFFSLRGQFMSANMTRELRAKADQIIENARFDGKSKNFSFDKFTARLQKAFLDQGEENQLSEERKVEKFLAALHVPNTDWLVGQVETNDTLRGSFTETVAFVGAQLRKQNLKDSKARKISALDATKTGDVPGHKKLKWTKGFNPKDPGAFLPNKIFRQLKPHERKMKENANKNRKNGGGGGKAGGNGSPGSGRKSQIAALTSQISELTSAVAASMGTNNDNANASSADNDDNNRQVKMTQRKRKD